MITTRATAAAALALATFTLAAARPAAGQDVLSRAKDLYVSAAYEDALALLDQIDRPPAPQAIEINEYRAFCMLALGRSEEASQVIAAIVEAQPTFEPAPDQISPRLLQAFQDVRRRVFPTIIRKTYAQAKAAFDRGDLKVAAEEFGTVVDILQDSDDGAEGDLADVQSLSKGFLDLIRKMSQMAAAGPRDGAAAGAPVAAAADSATPATVTPAQPAPAANVPAGSAASAPNAPAANPAPALDAGRAAAHPGIYGAEDTTVRPPIAILQDLPPWRPSAQDRPNYEANLVLVIDEQGRVASATVYGYLPPLYDRQLRRAAQAWRFQPALKDAVPVRYRRVIEIRLGS